MSKKDYIHLKFAIPEEIDDAELMSDGALSDFEDNEFNEDFVKYFPNTLTVGKKLWCCLKAN